MASITAEMMAELLKDTDTGNGSWNASDFMYDDIPQPANKLYEHWLTYYLSGIGGVTICCLGTIGNIMSLLVLNRKSMRLSTYSYLSALSISDILFLLATLMMLINDTRVPKESSQLESMLFYAYVFPYVHPIAVTFQTTSIWLVLGFTVDRYIMICHPFRAEMMCTITRARYVIAGIYIGGIIFNIPRFLEYQTYVHHLPDFNITKIYVQLTDIGKSPLYLEIVHSWMYLIFVYGVPFLTLAILNAFLIHAVHLSRKRGREINASERKRNDTTVMLIGVIVIFFVCQFPALIARMKYAFDITVRFDDSYNTLGEVGNFLVVLNSAINIVPYYFFGKKFQKEFWLLFCTPCISKRQFDRRFSNSVNDQRKMSCGNNLELRKASMSKSNQKSRENSRDSNQTNPLIMCDNGYLAASNVPLHQPKKPSRLKKLSLQANCFKNVGESTDNNGKVYSVLCLKFSTQTANV